MNDRIPAPRAADLAEVIEHPVGRKYADMNAGQKAVFIAKLATCICTFGFVFPNVQHD